MWVVSLHESERFYGTGMPLETVTRLFEVLTSMLSFELRSGKPHVLFKKVSRQELELEPYPV